MGKDLIVHESPKSIVSEAIRLLRTNISFICKNRKNQILLVTSSAPGEGKSWTSANLAIAYAQANRKVLLIDADLRKGRTHKIFGRFNSNGLFDYLVNVDNVDDLEAQVSVLMKTIKTTDVPNLFLITSGTIPPNPSELLGTVRIDNLIEIAKQNFDIIIFDAPPVSVVTDSLLLCKKVDYTILIAAVERTKKEMILNTKKSIQQVGGKIAGIVLNRMPMEKRKEYTKYYSQYSDENLPVTTRKKRNHKE